MIHPTALLAFAAQLREQARAALQAAGRQDPTTLRASDRRTLFPGLSGFLPGEAHA